MVSRTRRGHTRESLKALPRPYENAEGEKQPDQPRHQSRGVLDHRTLIPYPRVRPKPEAGISRKPASYGFLGVAGAVAAGAGEAEAGSGDFFTSSTLSRTAASFANGEFG